MFPSGCIPCVCMPAEARRGHQITWSCSYRQLWASQSGCLQSNSHLLEGQQVFLTDELSFQRQIVTYLNGLSPQKNIGHNILCSGQAIKLILKFQLNIVIFYFHDILEYTFVYKIDRCMHTCRYMSVCASSCSVIKELLLISDRWWTIHEALNKE